MNVGELMRMPLMGRASVISGERGIEREVSWCAADSSLKFDNWIMPGLLLLSTGSDLGLTTRELEERMLDVDAAGVALFASAGNDFPLPFDRSFFDHNAIPLISMPGRVNVVSFSKRFVSMMAIHNLQELRREDWLRDLSLGSTTSHGAETASTYGYQSTCDYRCLYLTLGPMGCDDPIAIEMGTNAALRTIQRRLSLQEAKVLTYADGDTVTAYVPLERKTGISSLHQSVEGVVDEIRRSASAPRCRAFLGCRASSPEEFSTSYSKALETEHLVRGLGIHDRVCFYDDWYMHMLLLKEPKPFLRERLEYTLEPLLDNEELLTTLTNYLFYGENVREAAEATCIHANTLKYRLRHVQDLLGVDLRDPNVRLRLRMAVTIHRYLMG